MTKPTMELVEEYGRSVACNCVPTAPEADALLSEIRQRIEAMETELQFYRRGANNE